MAWNISIMLICCPITVFPLMEPTWINIQAGNNQFCGDTIKPVSPVINKINYFIPNIRFNPAIFQLRPSFFFNLTCSIISSAIPSSRFVILTSKFFIFFIARILFGGFYHIKGCRSIFKKELLPCIKQINI